MDRLLRSQALSIYSNSVESPEIVEPSELDAAYASEVNMLPAIRLCNTERVARLHSKTQSAQADQHARDCSPRDKPLWSVLLTAVMPPSMMSQEPLRGILRVAARTMESFSSCLETLT